MEPREVTSFPPFPQLFSPMGSQLFAASPFLPCLTVCVCGGMHHTFQPPFTASPQCREENEDWQCFPGVCLTMVQRTKKAGRALSMTCLATVPLLPGGLKRMGTASFLLCCSRTRGQTAAFCCGSVQGREGMVTSLGNGVVMAKLFTAWGTKSPLAGYVYMYAVG